MTVAASYTIVQVQGDNTELDFDFTFKVFNASDVVVVLINRTTLVATPQTLSTHYTVTLNTSTPGGTVHFITAPTTDYDVGISRAMTLAQSADIPSGGLFREVQVENAFDKAMMIAQEHDELLDRALLQNPYSTAITGLTLPLPVAGKGLIWNSTATGLINSTTSVEDIIDAAAASASTASTQAGLATTARIAAQAALAATLAVAGVRGTFVNADLAAGYLTITHNKNLSAPYPVLVTIIKNTGVKINPDYICYANTVVVDLRLWGTLTGTWGYIIW